MKSPDNQSSPNHPQNRRFKSVSSHHLKNKGLGGSLTKALANPPDEFAEGHVASRGYPMAARRLETKHALRLRGMGAKCADCGSLLVTGLDFDSNEPLCREHTRARIVAELELFAAGMGRPTRS
jgi:hypothetical protein